MSKEFTWDDKSIEEMLVRAFSERLFVGSYKTPKTIIEEFKASHSTDKIKWEAGTVVKDTWYNAEYTKQEDGSWIRSKTSPRFVITDNEIGVGLRYVPISKLPQHTKLFTTEDGVDVFEGDSVWYYDLISYSVNVIFNLHKYTREPRYKYFSTNEKAEEYRLMNKPLLSVNDVIDRVHLESYTVDYFKKLIKERI